MLLISKKPFLWDLRFEHGRKHYLKGEIWNSNCAVKSSDTKTNFAVPSCHSRKGDRWLFSQPAGGKEGMAYHRRVAVHHADHLDVNPLLIHVLQQPHHLAHTKPFAVCVAHSNEVITLFQAIGLEKTRWKTGVKEVGQWNVLTTDRVNIYRWRFAWMTAESGLPTFPGDQQRKLRFSSKQSFFTERKH